MTWDLDDVMGRIVTDVQLTGNGVLNSTQLGPPIRGAISNAALGTIPIMDTAYVYHIAVRNVSGAASTVIVAQGHGAGGARVNDQTLFTSVLAAAPAVDDHDEEPAQPSPMSPIHPLEPWVVGAVIFGNLIMAFDNSGGNDVEVSVQRVDQDG